jgi:hypothetical protein
MFRNWSANFAVTNRIFCFLLLFGISSSASGAIFTIHQVQSFSFSDLNSSENLHFNGFHGWGTLTGVHVARTINETLTSQVFHSTATIHAIGNPTGLSATATTTTMGSTGVLLTSYIGGASSVALPVGSQGTQSGSVPFDVFGGNTGRASGTVTVADSHSLLIDRAPTPAPEPASMAIWGLGALYCAIAAYRRRVPPAISTSS